MRETPISPSQQTITASSSMRNTLTMDSADLLENIASYSLIDTIKETIKIDQGLDDGTDPQNRKEALASNEAQ